MVVAALKNYWNHPSGLYMRILNPPHTHTHVYMCIAHTHTHSTHTHNTFACTVLINIQVNFFLKQIQHTHLLV